MADLLQMPKSIRKREEEELSAYTARWLELADGALSATEKAAKALELARQEQERIRNDIQRTLENYANAGWCRARRIGISSRNDRILVSDNSESKLRHRLPAEQMISYAPAGVLLWASA